MTCAFRRVFPASNVGWKLGENQPLIEKKRIIRNKWGRNVRASRKFFEILEFLINTVNQSVIFLVAIFKVRL